MVLPSSFTTFWPPAISDSEVGSPSQSTPATDGSISSVDRMDGVAQRVLQSAPEWYHSSLTAIPHAIVVPIIIDCGIDSFAKARKAFHRGELLDAAGWFTVSVGAGVLGMINAIECVRKIAPEV